MAVQEHADIYAALTGHVQRWDRRARVGQSLIWLPRAVSLALIAAIVLALISRMRPLFTANQLIWIGAAAVVISVIAAAALVWMRSRDLNRLALRYDVMLRGDERMSTALELIDGRIPADADLIARQLADAEQWAQSADAKSGIPLRVRGGEWALIAVLAAVFAVLLILPNPMEDAIAQDAALEAALAAAEETVRDLTEEIAADPDLSEPERQALLQALETAQETLDRNGVSPEEAFAALSDVQTALGASAAERTAASQALGDAMSRAAGRIAEAMESSPAGDAADLQAQLEALADQLEDQEAMDEAQQGGMSDALRQAMQDLLDQNPELADQMGAIADALQGGDFPGAADQARDAADSAADSARSAEQDRQAGERMQDRAEQAEDAAEGMADQQSDQPQDGSQGETAEGSGQASEPPPEGQGDVQPGGQPQPDTAGDQPGGEQPSEGETGQSDQPGAGDPNVFSGSEGGQPDQGQNVPGAEGDQGTGAGAGDQAADSAAQSSPFSSTGADSSNDPDGEGEGDYDAVYAPERIGGESSEDNQLFLEPDSSGVPSVEGEFAENPTGESSVPYADVFRDYSSAADRALAQNRVPLALRDLIREYFASLEPESP